MKSLASATLRTAQLVHFGASSRGVIRPHVISPDDIAIVVFRHRVTKKKYYSAVIANKTLRLSFDTYTLAFQYGRAVADRYRFKYMYMLKQRKETSNA